MTLDPVLIRPSSCTSTESRYRTLTGWILIQIKAIEAISNPVKDSERGKATVFHSVFLFRRKFSLRHLVAIST